MTCTYYAISYVSAVLWCAVVKQVHVHVEGFAQMPDGLAVGLTQIRLQKIAISQILDGFENKDGRTKWKPYPKFFLFPDFSNGGLIMKNLNSRPLQVDLLQNNSNEEHKLRYNDVK